MGQEIYRTNVVDRNDILEQFQHKLVLIVNQNSKDQNGQCRKDTMSLHAIRGHNQRLINSILVHRGNQSC